ncbi:MAG: DivIVA domain-containing protein [Dermatophilaceae bacterium]
MWFFVLCAALAAAAVVALVVGRVDGTMGDPTSSLAHQPLPDDRELNDDDIAAVRFDVGLRGYRMDQVDDLVDRLRDELERLRTERDRLAANGGGWSASQEKVVFTAAQPTAPPEQEQPASTSQEQDEAAPHRPEWV